MSSTTTPIYDVAVVGGGPAGLHAAERLAARGFAVALFEEHASIGEPVHCTGLIASETYEQFGLPADSVLNELRVVRFYPPSGAMIEYATERAEAVVVDRHLFDRRLAERARDRGVQLHVGVRIRDVALEEDGVSIHALGREPVCARVCVLACGANYSLHRRLGLGMPSAFLQSAQMELAVSAPSSVGPRSPIPDSDTSRRASVGPDADTGRWAVRPPVSDPRSLDAVEVHFGDRVAPRGFAWAVPVDWHGEPRVRVGLMCASEPAARFQRFLADVASRRDVRPPFGPPRLKMLPLAPIPRTYGHRLVAIGDAAGLVKATTGGGVYYGLVSASVAADVLAGALATGELSEHALAQYEAGWRRRLGAELEAQMSLRRVAQRMTDADIEGVFDLARHDGVMPIVRRTACFNRHRDLIVSLLKHPPVRRLLYRHLAAGTRAAGWFPNGWLGATRAAVFGTTASRSPIPDPGSRRPTRGFSFRPLGDAS